VYLFFFPLNLIQVQGYSATEAGPLPAVHLLMFFLSSGRGIIDRYGCRVPLVVGPLIGGRRICVFYLRGQVLAVPTAPRSFRRAVDWPGMAVSVGPDDHDGDERFCGQSYAGNGVG